MRMRNCLNTNDTRSSDPVHAMVRRATRLMAAVGRQSGQDDRSIRAGVLGHLREAITGDEPRMKAPPVPGEPAPVPCVTGAGAYRLILQQFGLDRSDAYLQESLDTWVRRALDEAPTETEGDFRRCGPCLRRARRTGPHPQTSTGFHRRGAAVPPRSSRGMTTP